MAWSEGRIRRSSQAELKSRATTKRIPSRFSAAFAPTQGNALILNEGTKVGRQRVVRIIGGLKHGV